MDNKNNAAADAKYYLNAYLRDNDFPPLEALRLVDVEGDRLQDLLENVGHWLASTPLKTRQNDKLWLGRKSKADYFRRMKYSLEQKFPRHALFDGDGDDWFSDMKRSFKNECDRNPIMDNNLSNSSKDKQDNNLQQEQQHYLKLNSSSQNMAQHILSFGTKLEQFSVKMDQVDQLGKKLDALAARVDSSSNNNDNGQHSNNEEAMIELYQENASIKRAEIERLCKENDQLKRQLNEALAPPVEEADDPDDGDASVTSITDGDTEPVAKKMRKTHASASDDADAGGASDFGSAGVTGGAPESIFQLKLQTRYHHPDGIERMVPVGWTFPIKVPLKDLYVYWHIGDEANNIAPMKCFHGSDVSHLGRKCCTRLSNTRKVMKMIDNRAIEEGLYVREEMTHTEVVSLFSHGESAISEAICSNTPTARQRNISRLKLNSVVLYMQQKKRNETTDVEK